MPYSNPHPEASQFSSSSMSLVLFKLLGVPSLEFRESVNE